MAIIAGTALAGILGKAIISGLVGAGATHLLKDTAVGKWVDEQRGNIKGLLENTGGNVTKAIMDTQEKIADGTLGKDIAEGAENAWNGVKYGLADIGNGIWEGIENAGNGIWEGIKTGIKTGHDTIDSAVDKANEDVTEKNKEFIDKVKENLSGNTANPTPNNGSGGGGIVTPIIGDNSTSAGGIQDMTGCNEETQINNGSFNTQNILDYIDKKRQEMWDREDAIRKEVQAREDNAYQRAVEDAKKAGINANLINLTPAESGGGITQASQPNISELTQQIQIIADKLEEQLNREFEGDENKKDRITDTIGSLIQTVIMGLLFKK